MSIRRFVPVLVALAVVALVATASACPTCKDAVADNSPGGVQGAIAGGGDAASGFNSAIYLALGSVFTLIGGIGWRVYRAVNRNAT